MTTTLRPPAAPRQEQPAPATPPSVRGRQHARGGLLRPLRWAGRLRASWWAEDVGRPRWQGWLWTLALLALLLWTANQLQAFDWYTDHPAVDENGGIGGLPNTYTAVDHPAHLARERATADALRRGWLPRWISATQGGFPVEFYPVGGSTIVALLHLLSAGLIPLEVAHKLVIIGVFLLPPLAYWLIARREHLPLSVALLAAVLHLFVRGSWFGGGSRELIEYGLWPNVFAAYLTLFVLLWGADWLRRGDRRGLLLATAAATLAVYTNPRSIVAVAASCLAIGLVALSERVRIADCGLRIAELRSRRRAGVFHRAPTARLQSAILLAGRSALFTLLVGLLSAALLLPLRAHQDLYHFTFYLWFDSARDVWRQVNETTPIKGVVGLATLGIAVALLRRGFYARALAVQLLLSYLLITLVGWQWRESPLFAQLEGPRLLTTLRPALIFLAAFGIHELLRAIVRLVLGDLLALLRLRRAATWATTAASLLVGVTLLVGAHYFLVWDRGPLDRERRGLPVLETTDQPTFTAIEESARRFEAAAGPADKPLIMGNPPFRPAGSMAGEFIPNPEQPQHASFWIPALTGRDAFHNDYLWFWRTTDYADKELLQDEFWALERPFLTQHGLTMVLVDVWHRDLIDHANSRPHLRRLYEGRPGGYSVYLVEPEDPGRGLHNGWVTFSDGAVTALDVRPEHLTARGQTARPGTARIIINDYPRWRATVNGVATPIARTPDGYMAVPVPAGEVTVTLDYATEPVGWLARGLVTLGALLLFILTFRPLWPRRLGIGPRSKRISP